MDDVRLLHERLLKTTSSLIGDLPGAMREVNRLYGLGFWQQWGLRYKRRASMEFIEDLRRAYLDALAKSVRRDLMALRNEQAKGAEDAALESLVAEAETLLGRIQSRRKRHIQ